MNFEFNGDPIAIVVNPEKKKKNDVISVDNDRTKSKEPFEQFRCQPQQSIQHIPNPNQERSILYITGASGSGKSWYVKEFALQYKKMHPKREIFCFSALADDKGSLDKIKGLKRIRIHEPEFMIEPIATEEFKESLVIFDDTEAISDKRLRKKVHTIMDGILTTGRHFKISCCVCTHTACNANETKLILCETHSITIFPNGLGGRSLKYLLEGYFGLSKAQIKKIKSLKSRWVTINKTYPMTVISENEAYVLSHNEED